MLSLESKQKVNMIFRRSDPPPPRPPLVDLFVFQTEIFDAVERVQVEDGWVSMRLREDNGTGAPLLVPMT